MTIAVSAFVSLTLSPMMCALFLRDEKHAKHGKVYMVVERGFDRLLGAIRTDSISCCATSARPC